MKLHAAAFKGKTFESETRENSDDARGQYERLKREFGQEPDPDAWRCDPEVQPDAQARANGAEQASRVGQGEAKGTRFASHSIDDIEEPCLDVFFLIHGLMVRYGIHLTYGPSSVGKTFAKMHALLHVATGRKYNGRRTEKALVIYVTGEGERMFRNRLISPRKSSGSRKAMPPSDTSPTCRTSRKVTSMRMS